jgi:glycosyltransferase involved in cell wall biosynthesis
LRIGAGLQNKLLIGMSMGQPMVCTSIANEGIGAEDGKHLLIADDPRSFASAVIGLLRDDEKAQRIACQAREFVQHYWTWEYHFEALEYHIEKIVDER